MTFSVPEKNRITTGAMPSDASHGNNGAFEFSPCLRTKLRGLFVIASDQMGWEHVSVSIRGGTKKCLPTHAEMEWVKRKFWGDNVWVVEFHPPKSECINNHPCLHLWRPTHETMPVPPSIMVGSKDFK